jgi:hypothetical protein
MAPRDGDVDSFPVWWVTVHSPEIPVREGDWPIVGISWPVGSS